MRCGLISGDGQNLFRGYRDVEVVYLNSHLCFLPIEIGIDILVVNDDILDTMETRCRAREFLGKLARATDVPVIAVSRWSDTEGANALYFIGDNGERNNLEGNLNLYEIVCRCLDK